MKTLYCSILITLFCIPTAVFAQEVSGVVSGPEGMPIPGVNVSVKNSSKGTITNFDGKYTLSGLNENDSLVYSYVGYSDKIKVYNGQSTIDVQLSKNLAQLNEVVLIGYGSQNKQDATGAVTQITSEEFNKGAVVSPEGLINGKAAGVRVTSGGGQAGGGAEIRIRGGSSLSANNSPLIVVDGVPLDQRGVQGVRNQLNAINPNDIKEFTVLKDAAATAIYGSRASNGVILITTKKGNANSDLKVELDSKFSVGRALSHVDVLGAEEFRSLIESQDNTNPDLLGNARTDWQNEIYRTSNSTINNLIISQGFDNFYYRIGYNHTDERGILKTDRYRRDALNISLNQNLFDEHLKLTLTAKGSINRNDFPDQGAIGAATTMDPTQPIYDSSLPFGGYFEFNRISEGQTVAQQQAVRNPLALLYQYDNDGKSRRIISNIQADYKFHFLPDLKLSVNAGVDYAENEGYETRPVISAANNQNIDFFNDYEGINRNLLLDVFLNYKKNIEAINTEVDFTAGHSYQEYYISNQSVFTESNNIVDPPRNIDRNSLEGYFARGSFDIDDKYLISGSIRADGSSRFSEDNRWAYFPAASVGWKMQNENFLASADWLNQLKLRAGYGKTGNQEIGPNYGYRSIYTPSVRGASYQFGNQFYTTLRPEEYDEDLKWEELTTYNVGFDFGLLNNRLGGSFNAYYRETDDLLATVPVPAGANLSDQLTTNVGQTTSKGIELALNGTIFDQKDFSWDLNYNITFQDVEITNLTLGNNPDFFIPQGGIGGGIGNTIQLWKKGYDPRTFFVLEQVYDDNGNTIEGSYVDQNGDNTISEADRRPYRSATPDYFMGLTSSMRYKDFSLSFTLRGSFGNYNYFNNASSNGFITSGTVTPQDFYANFNSNIQETGFRNSQFFSDYYLQKADFVKLDNISLSYQVPTQTNFDITASFTAGNLFTITGYDGLDPEISSGIDNNFYPRSRNFVLGLNVKF